MKPYRLMKPWRSKNFGIHPQDPAFDDDYDEEADYNAYLDACEERAERQREERYETACG